MRVWHDDVRRPPDSSWVWARTNEQAKALLDDDRRGGYDPVTDISLDHDLGGEDLDPDAPDVYLVRGQGAETGLDLVNWMCEHRKVPGSVTIHSWNPAGTRNMAARLNYYGYNCRIAPYTVPHAG